MNEDTVSSVPKISMKIWPYITGISALVLVLISGVIYVYPPLTVPVREALSARFMPSEMKGVVFLADSDSGTTAYRTEGFRYAAQALDGVLVSANADDGIFSSLVVSKEKFSIRTDEEVNLQTESTLSGLARAPGGNTVAFSQLATTSQQVVFDGNNLPSANLAPDSWLLKTQDVRTKTVIDIGRGVSPVFLDNEHVAYVTSLGMYVVDITTGISTQILPKSFARVPLLVISSPDRTLVGIIDQQSRTISLYKVTPTSAENVSTLPLTGRIMSYALGNSDLYLLRRSSFGTEIWKEPISGGAQRKLITIPESMRITRLLIHSL